MLVQDKNITVQPGFRFGSNHNQQIGLKKVSENTKSIIPANQTLRFAQGGSFEIFFKVILQVIFLNSKKFHKLQVKSMDERHRIVCLGQKYSKGLKGHHIICLPLPVRKVCDGGAHN